MNDAMATISDFVEHTARSLGRSFAKYWPVGENYDYDPPERNVSFHFAHAMLSAGFSVFAEADHPKRKKVRGIDVLGLSPTNEWFLGCEFKRLYSPDDLQSLSEDVFRLQSFWPRTEFDTSVFGQHIPGSMARCTSGYGLVGGLHWVSAKKESSRILNIWDKPELIPPNSKYARVASRLKDVEAEFHKPPIVIEFPTGERYYLLAAVFEISQDAGGDKVTD